MIMNKKSVLSTVISLALLGNISGVVQTAFAATTNTVANSSQELHIDKDGNIRASQVTVMQIAGTSIYVRYYIGLAFLRILIKTDKTTKIFRRFGDEIPLGQVNVGDMLNVEGKIESGADSLSIITSKIINFSNQKEVTNFQGIVAGTGSTTGSFILNTQTGPITIQTNPTTQIKKGSRIISTDLVKNGDSVTDVTGTFDHATKTIAADVVVVYIDKNIFLPRNFEGTLTAIASSNPTTLAMKIEGKNYTVALNSNTNILNKARGSVSIKRYLEGDTVRIYGAIREAEDPIIDAQIVRNTSLQ
ncbi:MAG: hypothetical protein V4467_02840 [Patescibacteria group bacterium]